MSVIIGSKYVGKAEQRNNQTGEFWSVMPELSEGEFKLQTSLLKLLKREWDLTIRVKRPVWLFWKH